MNTAVSYSELIARINSAPLEKSQSHRLNDQMAAKEKELTKITHYKQCLYQDWKDGEITQQEYRDMKADYERQAAELKDNSSLNLNILHKVALVLCKNTDMGKRVSLQKKRFRAALGPGKVMLCVTLYWVIIWRKALRFGGFAVPGHSRKIKKADAQALIDEVTEISYGKAVELVTDAVRAETQL